MTPIKKEVAEISKFRDSENLCESESERTTDVGVGEEMKGWNVGNLRVVQQKTKKRKKRMNELLHANNNNKNIIIIIITTKSLSCSAR